MVTLSSFIFVNGTVKQYNFIDTCRLAFNELNTANELFSRDIRGDWGGGENLLSLTLPLSIHLINHEKKSMRMKADLSYQLVCIFRAYYLFSALT